VSGGSRVDLSADNYLGVIYSYCQATKIRNKPGVFLEWVREDARAIQNNDGAFPTPPGAYYIEVISDDEYVIDKFYDVYAEPLIPDVLEVQLAQAPHAGSLRLYEMPARFLLYEGVNYTIEKDGQGKPTGRVTLAEALPANRYLEADYRYFAGTTDPIKLYPMNANNQALPGVVLAFGRKIEVGDQAAVVVSSVRQPTALEFGGLWQINLDLDITSTDLHDRSVLADETTMYLWAVRRSELAAQGLNIIDVQFSGESEEVYDEAGDDYLYVSAVSVSVEAHWSLHVPLDKYIRSAGWHTALEMAQIAGLNDDQLAAYAYSEGRLQALEALGLETWEDPFWSGRTGTFEMLR
jgi:hypothetical protein